MTNGSFLDKILDKYKSIRSGRAFFIMVIINIKPIPIIRFFYQRFAKISKLKNKQGRYQFLSCTIFSIKSYRSLRRYRFLVRNKNLVKSFASRTQSILIVSGFKSISHKAINGKFQQL